jgi:alcohol sulfotransferase
VNNGSSSGFIDHVVSSAGDRQSNRVVEAGRIVSSGTEGGDLLRVVIASYPKSGRTWLSFLIANYLNDICGLLPRVNFRSVYRIIQSDGAPVAPLDVRIGGRTLKFSATHADPDQVQANRIIQVVRNPYDVLVSGYYHNTQQHHNFAGSLSDYVRDERWGVQSYQRYHVRWRRVSQSPKLVVEYEYMHQDATAQLRRVMEFCGLHPIDDEALSRSVRLSSFTVMRRRELNGPRIPQHAYDLSNKEALRTRCGQVGDGLRVLSSSDADYISKCLSLHSG